MKKTVVNSSIYNIHVDNISIEKLLMWADENNISNKDVPRNGKQLRSLSFLDLTEDDGYVLKSIPKEIGVLTNLTRLSLTIDSDHCVTLPEEMGLLTKLKELFVDSLNVHQITLPKNIEMLSQLETIYLSGNVLVSSLVSILKNCQSLKKLHIDNNQALKTLPKHLCDCSSLETLELINNRNLLLTQKQLSWAIDLRDDEKGYERVYCTELADGTSVSYTIDYGQKFQYYCIMPF